MYNEYKLIKNIKINYFNNSTTLLCALCDIYIMEQ